MGRTHQGRKGRGLIGRARRADGILGTATIPRQVGCWALVALVALVFPSCQGGGLEPGAPVESAPTGLSLPAEPGAETALSALAASVKSANALLANLIILR